jgi:AcrR family transcriptional regulator
VNPTKAKLLVAAAESLREDGIAGLSARVIAARAGVNQALVFYHFGTLTELVDAAVRLAVDESADSYREQLAAVGSLRELLTLGRALHERERERGNVAMMAQLMAGAQRDPALAGAAGYALLRWNGEIGVVIRRVLGSSPLGELTDLSGMTRAVSAAFIGLELYDGVDPAGAAAALDALQDLAAVVEALDDLGPVGQRALRATLRRMAARP